MMEITAIILLSLIGVLGAFLSAVLTHISQDTYQKISETEPELAESLTDMKERFEDKSNPFFIIETLSYSITLLILGVLLSRSELHWPVIAGISAGVVIFGGFVRYTFYGLGIRLAERSVMKFKGAIFFYSSLAAPLVFIANRIIDTIGGDEDEDASRDEISALVESAREEGSLDDDEYRILKNIMHFSDVLVSDVMTPRTVVFTLEGDKKIREVLHMPELQMYSRFPVYEGESLDDGVLGYVISKDVLHAALNGEENKQLKDFMHDVYFIPENAELDKALDRFLKRRQHMFMVVDEYGGVEGLITMEDVLETILGVEIVDEADKFVDLRLIAKQRRDRRISNIAMHSGDSL